MTMQSNFDNTIKLYDNPRIKTNEQKKNYNDNIGKTIIMIFLALKID